MTNDLTTILAAAEVLAGTPALSLSRVRGGRNSRIYRLVNVRGVFAIKVYPDDPDDPRNRLATEFSALRFLAGYAAVPRAVAAAEDRRCGLYEWIEGEAVETHSAEDIGAFLAFLRATHLRRSDAAAFGDASDACLSEVAILEEIERRRGQLAAIDDERLQVFLRAYDRVLMKMRPRNAQAKSLDPASRTLSPSDAGFHNALRRPTGELVFIDLEYFGWDDPVKLVADVLWHPGMILSMAERDQFLKGAIDIYSHDDAFKERLSSRYALFGLRWILIILNEFLKPVWKRRVEAGERRSHRIVERQQLAKAAVLFDKVRHASSGIES